MPIVLNVGGRFETSLETLKKNPGAQDRSMLANLNHAEGEEVFIDRDANYFSFILNYLRDGSVSIDEDACTLAQIKREPQLVISYLLEEFGSCTLNESPSRMEAILVLFVCATSIMSQELWNQYPENGNYIVPYKFTGTYSSQENSMIKAAMQKIADNTCVEFRLRTNEEEFVEIVNKEDRSCGANVGRIGDNRIYLESNRNTNCMDSETIMVNLLHSLGLSFEHQRVDRDKYINVHFENIADPNLRLYLAEADSTQKYTSVPYDYLSIMHGAKNAYAKPGTITIETLDPTYQDQIGTATEPSARDYEKINLLYQCNKP